MKTITRALIAVCLIVLACDDDSEHSAYPDLRIYLDRFEQEASDRGYDFDLSNVETVYVDNIVINNQTYCGYGFFNYDGAGKRRIEISKAAGCGWSNLSDLEREKFIFHEIGHAFFNRGHDDKMLCDGSVASLMTSLPSYASVYTEPSGEKRDYYISELIDPLAANAKCIKDEKDWSTDAIFYRMTNDDKEWILYTDNGKYLGTQGVTQDYLMLRSIDGINAQANAYWFKNFNAPNIPECAKVTFRVKMNSESLTGKGAAISVRLYKSTLAKTGAVTEQYARISTEENPVSGEVTDVIQELVIPCYTRSTTQMIIFVVLLGETKGQVTFEDIEVVVEPG